jgi:hypothetical protein
VGCDNAGGRRALSGSGKMFALGLLMVVFTTHWAQRRGEVARSLRLGWR